MNFGFKKYKLGDFLSRVKDGINLKDNVSYKRATIRINNKGISVRDELLGKNIKTKRQFLIAEGQFLMSKIDARNGAFGIVPKDLDNGIITGNFWAFDVNDSIVLADFFKNFTLSPNFIEICSRASTGSTNRKYLNEAKFLDIEISIPPINQQKSILKKIDLIRTNYISLAQEIQSQEENLSKLRQSILQDALQGELTKEWRKQNPDTEPASELIKKIKTKKVQLSKNKKIKKDKSLSPITKTEIPYEPPETWELCYLRDLIKETHAGKSPLCEKRPAELDEYGVLKTTAIQDLYFLENENKAILNLSKINLETEVKKGDILITRAGPSNRVGILTYIKDVRDKLLLSDKTVRINYFNQFINGEYLALLLSGGISKIYLDSKKSGMALSQVNISQSNMVLTPVLLAPLEEQKAIVEKVNQLFTSCDALEQEIINGKTNTEKLIQSVLSDLLGGGDNILISKTISKEETKKPSRKIKYNSKTLLMDLVELLKENGKMHAEDLWKMSKYPNDIDVFYAELKKQIEEEKSIKESDKKSYLELV